MYAFDFALEREGNSLMMNLLQDAANTIEELKPEETKTVSAEEKLMSVLHSNAVEYAALEKENATIAEVLLSAARLIEKLEKEKRTLRRE